MLFRTRGSLAFACLLVLGNGCGGGGSSTPTTTGPVTSAVKQTGDLQFTMTISKSTYARGEAVPFTFTVTNVGTQPILVTNQLDLFRVTIISKGAQVVSGFPTANQTAFYDFKLAPGESKSESDTWDQRDDNKQQVPKGQYLLSSHVPANEINTTFLLDSLPVEQWGAFWQANYASTPLTITIR